MVGRGFAQGISIIVAVAFGAGSLTLPNDLCAQSAPITGETLKKPRPPRPEVSADGRITLGLVARDGRWASLDPQPVGWSQDGRTFRYSLAARDDAGERRSMSYDVARGTVRELDAAARAILAPTIYDAMGTARRDRGAYARRRTTHDRRLHVFVRRGDLWLHDTHDGSTLRLTRSSDPISAPRFSLDEQRILFVQRGNVHELDLAGGLTRQLTDIRTGTRPTARTAAARARTAQEKRLVQQQTELFAWARAKRRKRNADATRRAAERAALSDRLLPTWVGRWERARIVSIAPTGRWVVVELSTKAPAAKRAVVPDYVTESGFAETRSARAKVGAPRAARRWALLDVERARLRPIAPTALAKADADYGPFRWSPDGTKLAALAISRDHRTRWILTIDPLSTDAHVTDAEHDAAWIGGPAWRRFGWLDDSARLFFVSERTGWAHLCTAHYTGRSRRSLTDGAWEVQNVRLSWDRSTAWIIATKKHPGERHLYSITLDAPSATLRCLTDRFPGIDTVSFAPDERRFVVSHSGPTTPPALSMCAIEPDGTVRPPTTVHRGATETFSKRTWITPRIVDFLDKHGNRIHARLYAPSSPHRMRPAVIRVHGSGYAQSAHRRWQRRSNDFFFAQYLLERGYSVLDLDYRGSAGYGRGCRTDIAGHMGDIEIDSGVAAVEYLVTQCGVERERIGIFGGSYGGFFTLMALLRNPGVFKVGVSLYPVTDWQHYNHWYASRILGTPDDNPGAYRRSSPIYHAPNLRDRLMIQHGVVDTNVHYQDTMRFAQRLIESGKTGWDVISYPVEGHGWTHESTRLDSYRRMAALFDEVLLRPTIL